jgi:hemoglobin
MTIPETGTRRDIENQDDIERLVIAFYEGAFADPVLGRIFVDVAKMDLLAHLPHMCDFWSVAILKQGKYGRNAFDAHYRLNQVEPLTPALFQRWEDLWHDTVDDLFAGEKANLAKLQASRISGSIQRRLAQGQPSNALRLVPRRT